MYVKVELTSQQRAERGTKASRLMHDEFFQELLEETVQLLKDKMATSEDVEEVINHRMALRGIEEIGGVLRMMVNDGEVARASKEAT